MSSAEPRQRVPRVETHDVCSGARRAQIEREVRQAVAVRLVGPGADSFMHKADVA